MDRANLLCSLYRLQRAPKNFLDAILKSPFFKGGEERWLQPWSRENENRSLSEVESKNGRRLSNFSPITKLVTMNYKLCHSLKKDTTLKLRGVSFRVPRTAGNKKLEAKFLQQQGLNKWSCSNSRNKVLLGMDCSDLYKGLNFQIWNVASVASLLKWKWLPSYQTFKYSPQH